MQRVHGGTDWTPGTARARGLRTVNMKLMSVTLDVSRLSGWLNADAYCRGTPRHMRRATRVGGRREGVGGRWRCMQRARRNRLGTGHGTCEGGLRTRNMEVMSVTLDVSQLEMSSLKFDTPENRLTMSVIAETPQSEIGPYSLRAAALLLTHSWTAASRPALVAKVPEPDDPEHVPEPQVES